MKEQQLRQLELRLPEADQDPVADVKRQEVEQLIDAFAARFVNRWDWFALQKRDGSYRAFHKPLTPGLVRRHLRGEVTLGVYALDQDSRARWVCYDADDEDTWAALIGLGQQLQERDIFPYLETSRRGGHLWLFLEEPLAGRTVRMFASALLPAGLNVEVFPKQETAAEGPGSLVRLPLGIHRRDGRRHTVEAAPGDNVPDQLLSALAVFAQARAIPASTVAAALAEVAAERMRAAQSRRTKETDQGSLIARIKSSIDIYDFISQYVELTPAGRGHCPFHDDKHMSFSVNRQARYFNCFAGCGGGDVIVFLERLKRVPRKMAVRELSSVLRDTGD